jgi:uncharacterized Fe-S cluster-containing radical SAM superfamily protein
MVREINIQIINRCQLKCKWCARSWLDKEILKQRESEYMTLIRFTDIVDICHDYGITHYDLTPMMGDLLLDTQLFQKLDYLNSIDCKKFSFTTNLLALPKTMPIIKKLLSYTKLHLGVSIYGHDCKSYEENTGKDLFYEFSTNMQSLFKCYDKDGATLEFFMRYPMKYKDYPDGVVKIVLDLFKRLYNVKINESEMYNLNWGGLIPYGKLDTLLGPIEKRGVCPTAGNGTILHNGDFALCYMNDAYRTTVIDNVFNHDLEQIYNSPKYKEIIFKQARSEYEGICKVCNERWWKYGK